MKVEQIVVLIGIGVTFIVGVANLVIAIKNSRKTTFINSITANRVKYIQELRNHISEFCGLVYSYNNRLHELSPENLFLLHRESDKLKYLIALHLNPEDYYWDRKIMSLIDEILHLSNKDPTQKINELIIITQFLLKLEWEGVKKESKNGIIPDLEKKELYNKYVELHKKYLSAKLKQ